MSLNILYVEDEKHFATTMLSVLEDFCENLYFADNGEDGLKLFLENKPNLIISDIQMPKLDGIEMMRKIREIDKDVPTYITSAHYEYDTKKELQDLNIAGIFSKPIELKLFLLAIEGHMK